MATPAQCLFAALALFALASPVPASRPKLTPDQKVSRALTGLSAGEPERCIPVTPSPSSEVHGDVILYRVSRNLTWKNATRGSCGRSDDILVTRLWGNRICKGDLIQTMDRTTGHFSGTCILGEFVPYRRTAK